MKSIHPFISFIVILTLVLGLGACGTKVSRLDVNEVHDISGNWNDTDSRLVSEEMISDVLSRAWLPTYKAKQNKLPVVIVGEIRNLSHEHLNLSTFIRDMERALVNSGQVEFVASSNERDDIRTERKDQDMHSREDTRKAMGQEIGADFMLKGTINTIIDQEGKTAIKFYQVDLDLISMTDNRKVWIGQKKIKKLVKKKALRF